MPVLVGSVPGVTATVKRVKSPDSIVAGVAKPTAAKGNALLRGFGALTVKSEALLSVSTLPFPFRRAAVVLLNVGVGAVSEQLALPKPTKSTMLALVGHAPIKAVELFTSATLPAVALNAIVPDASGVGRLVVPPDPAASWIK
jgi:hypothetical protein